MIHQIFAVSLVLCFSSILIADALLIMPGGRYPVSSDQFDELKTQLENSNLDSALGGDSSVQIKDILSATQQAVPGMDYHILAYVSIKGEIKKVCFFASKIEEKLTVTSAQVDANKDSC